jgi:hypothetical protein
MTDQKELKKVYLRNLEESIILRLAEVKSIDVNTAMQVYYSSELSGQIERGENGIEYLDYKNLVDELIETEAGLFERK